MLRRADGCVIDVVKSNESNGDGTKERGGAGMHVINKRKHCRSERDSSVLLIIKVSLEPYRSPSSPPTRASFHVKKVVSPPTQAEGPWGRGTSCRIKSAKRPNHSEGGAGLSGRALEVRRMPKEEAPAEITNAIAQKSGPAQSNDGGVYTRSAASNIQTSRRPTKIDYAAETLLRPLRTHR